MYRILAITALMLAVPLHLKAQEGDMPQQTAALDEPAAIARATQSLAKTLNVAESEIELISVKARTWNDSGMGCGKRGGMAMDVITPGHAVLLRAQGKEHRMHVSRNQVVLCDGRSLMRKPGGVSRARGVETMTQLARDDLAKQLNIDAAQIRIAGVKAHQWADSTMECPSAGETIRPGPLRGYRLLLRYDQRIYTYHTDMSSVRACPAISED